MQRRKPTRAETPIERIYREVNGRKMPPAIKRVLLRRPRLKVNRVKECIEDSKSHFKWI
jgi:hypothetical protein